MSNPEEELTYTQASQELERILAELQSEACDVDTLTVRTRRAVELLALCREKLTATDQEIRNILQTLQPPQQ